MQRHKSARHVNAARARWRAAESRAQTERDDGIHDRPALVDGRNPIPLDLRCAGGPNLQIEPRFGYVAWRARDLETQEIKHVAALKELLHRIADDLPRMLSIRSAD